MNGSDAVTIALVAIAIFVLVVLSRSVRIVPGAWPRSMSHPATASTKGVGPHT